MGKRKDITVEVKNLVIEAVNKNISYKQVSRLYGVSKSEVGNIVKRFRETGSVENKKRTGRKKVTSEKDDRILIRMSKKDPRKNAVELNAILRAKYSIKCSVDTIKRRLRHANLFGRRPSKKPLISMKNRIARIRFAKEHLHWTTKEWSKVLFSDESKFMVFQSDGIRYVRRPNGTRFDQKYQLPTVKHGGGNVMVWGCFSRDLVGPIHRINGIMDQEMYKGILRDVMLPHAKDKMPRGWWFQQDNDPKHTAKSVKEFFKSKKIRVMDWPSQSPDLNPIEHLWEHVDRQFKGLKPKNKDELFENIKNVWQNIPLDVIINLIDSLPRRCQAVIKAKGYPTKY